MILGPRAPRMSCVQRTVGHLKAMRGYSPSFYFATWSNSFQLISSIPGQGFSIPWATDEHHLPACLVPSSLSFCPQSLSLHRAPCQKLQVP